MPEQNSTLYHPTFAELQKTASDLIRELQDVGAYAYRVVTIEHNSIEYMFVSSYNTAINSMQYDCLKSGQQVMTLKDIDPYIQVQFGRFVDACLRWETGEEDKLLVGMQGEEIDVESIEDLIRLVTCGYDSERARQEKQALKENQEGAFVTPKAPVVPVSVKEENKSGFDVRTPPELDLQESLHASLNKWKEWCERPGVRSGREL